MSDPRRNLQSLQSRVGPFASIAAVVGVLMAGVVTIGYMASSMSLLFSPMGVIFGGLLGVVAAQVAIKISKEPLPTMLASGLLLILLVVFLSPRVGLPASWPEMVGVLTGLLAQGLLVLKAKYVKTWLGVLAAFAVLFGSVVPVGAWSIDESSTSDSNTAPGNGIDPTRDTHALLLSQGVSILEHDQKRAVADFLLSADPTAPYIIDSKTGQKLAQRQSYLWRLQTGSRDADHANKKQMPDHFFNWWTHSGKGLIAGPSSATYAEEQYALAVKAWKKDDRSQAMYHLGAAAHLVADACTPPHSTFLVPGHRSYEEWILGHQDKMLASSKGIYRNQFATDSGHGGERWSSNHTRGWVDQCAHRGSEYIANAIQPPSDDPLLNEQAAKDTTQLLWTAQRITAGYLDFFFDEVGGP